MLVMSETIRPLILKRETSSAISQAAINDGMRTLRDDGWQKVTDGKTTIEEILRVTMSDEHLKDE
jgi:type II secretory ATPase GspE/PulE/Tfp pilus assembly ATPase PilB-like protein